MAKNPKNWREILTVHPAAELFPAVCEADQKEFEKDIDTHGIRVAPVLWRETPASPWQLLDGRRRLDTAENLGWLSVRKKGIGYKNILLKFDEITGGDPYAIALSLNAHRRMLTREQKEALIDRLLDQRPDTSNVQIADAAKVSDKTVGARRAKKGTLGNSECRVDTRGGRTGPKPRPSKQSQPQLRPKRSQPEPTAAVAPF
jgi:hypothetical protein